MFLILDFGSQYSWLIARSFRELGFYARVEPFDFPLSAIKQLNPAGVVLSGGPGSVLSRKAPHRCLKELAEVAPLLGICYGLQLIAHQWGGQVRSVGTRTYGSSQITWQKNSLIFTSDLSQQRVWMSHGDFVSQVPKGFRVLARTCQKIPAVLFYKGRAGQKLYLAEKNKNSLLNKNKSQTNKRYHSILALQFHPEVSHSQKGKEIISYFAKNICEVKKKKWTADSIIDLALSSVAKQLGESVTKKGVKTKDNIHILCALSGGVDSTVTACLLTKYLGADRVHCVFVDTGLLRQDEFQQVLLNYKKLKLNVVGIRAEKQFLKPLMGVVDPERKRKIIGRVFIDVFKKYRTKHKYINYLAQGTLYPDVIESLSFKGPSVTIKSHHNVGGLPQALGFKLVEPLRYLFKDEVRLMGKKLKIPSLFLDRHPFPGPGLAIRIEGEVTSSRLKKLRQADAIYIEELYKAGLYHKIWQAFCVLLPVKSVGVQGDKRTYHEMIVIRAVTSQDGMTADWFRFAPQVLQKISNRITNEVFGINRVVYDVTSKPPGTIEWM